MKRTVAATIFLLPLISLLFAYFELGGNWFAYRMLDKQTIWSVGGTVVFATIYSFVAAGVAKWRHVDLGLLMVNYGFGFSVISLILKLEWNRIPEFTPDIINQNPTLLIVLVIALVGFAISGFFVAVTPPIHISASDGSIISEENTEKISLLK